MNKQLEFIKRLLLISISLITMISFADEKKKEPTLSTKMSKYQNMNLYKIPAKLYRDIEIADTTSRLIYDKLWIEETPKPSLKMYSNKEFKGDPTAELNDKGFYFHGKLICKYLYDWEVPKRRILHDAKDAENACEDIGPLDSFIDGDAGTYIYIYVKDATDSYYEVEFKKEKFYINIKETKGFRYIESQLKQVARLHNRYKDLIKNDEEFRGFINRINECIKKEDLNCLSGNDSKAEWSIIQGWLENVCNPEVITDSTLKCKKSTAENGEEYFERPKLTGSFLKLFWKHIKSCDLGNFENPVPYGDFNIEKRYWFSIKDNNFKEGSGYGYCEIYSVSQRKDWKIYINLDVSHAEYLD